MTVRSIDEELILFSVQDLLGYLRVHATMSGIQRASAGIALHAMAAEGDRVGFIVNDLSRPSRDGAFLRLDPAALRDVIAYASGSEVDHERLRMLLDDAEATAGPIRPGRGTAIILLGSFWSHGNTLDRYLPARREGARIGAYVYDVIPVTHPEYCVPGLVRDFSLAIAELALVADFILTISDYTRATLARLLRENGGRAIPMATVPLAHAMTHAPDGPGDGARWPRSLRRLRGRRYVAYVSTIEGRKNHLYVVAAWQQLIADGVDVPDLLFVGRSGWRNSGLMDLLDGTGNLGGRVHLAHDLSDAELATVYAGCLFTVFTSFVEGWGLPVGESLVHHVPCAASNTSSIPEVGGDFVDYLDPLNLRDGIAVLRRLIEDDAYRAARRRHIADDFVPRGWDDVGRDFLGKARAALAVERPARPLHPLLGEGTRFAPGRLVSAAIRLRDYMPGPLRLMLADDFPTIDPDGAWLEGGTGALTFATPLPAGTPVRVLVELTATADHEAALDVADGAALPPPRWQPIAPDRRNLLEARGSVCADGCCTVTIRLAAPAAPGAARAGIALIAIGYAREGDAAAHDELVERFAFHDLTP